MLHAVHAERAHLDADRQVAEERCLNSMGDGAKLEYRYISHQHSVTLRTLLGLHQILDSQRYRLVVETPEQLQKQVSKVGSSGTGL